MYKFKNVKKLLIEFSRGEGLSVPTDSIKFVKVDGDELSGAASGGSSEGETVKSFMAQLLSTDERYSDCVAPDAYFWASSEEEELTMIDYFKDLFPIAISAVDVDAFLFGFIPAYRIDTVLTPGERYIMQDWTSANHDIEIQATLDNNEYGVIGRPEGYVY